MDVVLAVVGAAVAVIAVLAIIGFVMSRSVVRGNADRAALALGEPGPDDVQESAALLQPAEDSGIGVLRLTPDELVFAAGNDGTVRRILRSDIEVATSSQDLDGVAAPLKRPALVIGTRSGQMSAFAVSDVPAWIDRLGG